MAAQFCPFCGKPVTAAGATFCAYCGRSLTDQSSPSLSPPPAQAAPPLAAQPVPPQPLPPGANPPGMVAVPVPNTPVAGPPPVGAATGPAYYHAPPPAYGATYPPPGYTAPPPAYAAAAYGTYAALAYPPGASARPAFSTARAVGCAIAVVAIGAMVVTGRFVVPSLFNYFLLMTFALAFGIPSGYSLSAARLHFKRPLRASIEAVGINTALLLVFIGIGLEYNIVQGPRFIGLYFPAYFGWARMVVFGLIGALVASAIGLGFARIAANWTVARAYSAAEGARPRLLQSIGITTIAFLLFFAVVLLYTRVPGGWIIFFYRFGLVGHLFITYLPLAISGIVLAWYATWSTLRLLRQSVVAPPTPVPAAPVPVAPGV